MYYVEAMVVGGTVEALDTPELRTLLEKGLFSHPKYTYHSFNP